MKRLFVRTAIVASLMTAMVLGALPFQAQACSRNTRVRQAYYRQPQPRYVYVQPTADRKHRSLGKSVLIVGGSAAAGAGIGALAGGKKGAGIGAIAGGLGGLIYDRATANHH